MPRVGVLIDSQKIADANNAYEEALKDKGISAHKELAARRLPADMLSFLNGGNESLDYLTEAKKFIEEKVDSDSPTSSKMVYDIKNVKLLAPVPRPGKIICGVLNGRFVWERVRTWKGDKKPDHPFYFMKATSSVIGPGDAIEVPEFLTWPEVELGWIFNKKCKNSSASDFRDHIIGFTVFNDVTGGGLHEEETVRYTNPDGSEGLPFRFLSRYKGYDTFGPMGPYIVTKDEIKNPNSLVMKCWLNDILVQDGSLEDVVTTCETLTQYISSIHTLFPGDVITSGTCEPAEGRMLSQNSLGSAKSCKCEIEKVGILENPVKAIKSKRKYSSSSQVI